MSCGHLYHDLCLFDYAKKKQCSVWDLPCAICKNPGYFLGNVDLTGSPDHGGQAASSSSAHGGQAASSSLAGAIGGDADEMVAATLADLFGEDGDEGEEGEEEEKEEDHVEADGSGGGDSDGAIVPEPKSKAKAKAKAKSMLAPTA